MVMEFLHQMIELLEDFLGSPLIAQKIESNYDVVAQLLTEICDAGLIASTEPNALRELVDVPGFVSRLLGTPSSTSATGMGNTGPLGQTAISHLTSQQPVTAIPWRSQNVRHTQNEFYVDIVESLTCVIAPSGRPLAARANGSIACKSQVTGVPDLLLTLDIPGTSSTATPNGVLELPVFHPCVRLKTWRESPGTISFIPPDGRFVLAGYEVDLLPFTTSKSSLPSSNLKLPVSLDMKTGLGRGGNEFELRVTFSNSFPGWNSSKSARSAAPSKTGSSQRPALENLVISVPLPETVRNASELRVSRGTFSYAPGAKSIEWKVFANRTQKDLVQSNIENSVAVLKASLVEAGKYSANLDTNGLPSTDFEADTSGDGDYSEDTYRDSSADDTSKARNETSAETTAKADKSYLMPAAATASFQVRGWLPSGIKVESLEFTKSSRGLNTGAGMGGAVIKPYKGVKYLCACDRGIEIRC
jgi:AP-3 complex subunit mu